MGARRGGAYRVLAASLFVAVGAHTATAGPPLRRDLGSYFAFGLRSIGLKNITVTGACNVGVDCAQPNANSDCGGRSSSRCPRWRSEPAPWSS
jgi:hypothetical protein